jgi:uncharacterized ferredoxin-like protein
MHNQANVDVRSDMEHIPLNFLKCDQQTHTLRQNYNNVLIGKQLHASGVNSPSSGRAQLYKTIVQLFYHSQYVELSQVPQCVTIEMDMGIVSHVVITES